MNTTIFRNIVRAFEGKVLNNTLENMGYDEVHDVPVVEHLPFMRALIDNFEQAQDSAANPGKPQKQKPSPAMAADNSMEKPIRLTESDLETQLAKLQDAKDRQNTILNDLLRGVSDIAVLQDRVNETREQINKLYQKWPQTLRPDAYRNVGNYSESGTEYQDV